MAGNGNSGRKRGQGNQGGQGNMNVTEAAKVLGHQDGTTLVEEYGPDHMAKIGRKGGRNSRGRTGGNNQQNSR